MADDERFAYLHEEFALGFIRWCGFTLREMESGICVSELGIREKHLQQDGFVHAGVIATMADHTAGYAAFTTVSPNERILTIEFKINYLRPAVGTLLICRSRVVNNGRKVKVTESEVYSFANEREKMVAKALLTMMAVPSADLIK